MTTTAERDEAFDRLYRAEFGRLAGAMRLACGGDAALGEEVAQEAFLRLYTRWDRVMRLDRPLGWLYATSFNLVRRSWRSRRRAEAVPAERDLGHAPPNDDRLALEQALASLPLSQRQAVVVRHVLGFSTDEAAQILDTNPVALRALLHRAVKSLRLQPALADKEA
jgi:RNA polymerase sigma-70 factor (ECF subfamily)